MDVHDCSSVSKSQPLRPGNIVTIEPGVYIPLTDSRETADCLRLWCSTLRMFWHITFFIFRFIRRSEDCWLRYLFAFILFSVVDPKWINLDPNYTSLVILDLDTGTGNAGAATFCLSGTGTVPVMHAGSGSGSGSWSNIKWYIKVKKCKLRWQLFGKLCCFLH